MEQDAERQGSIESNTADFPHGTLKLERRECNSPNRTISTPLTDLCTVLDRKHGEIILHPIPSSDPNDPLNWGKTYKALQFGLVGFYALMVFVNVDIGTVSSPPGTTPLTATRLPRVVSETSHLPSVPCYKWKVLKLASSGLLGSVEHRFGHLLCRIDGQFRTLLCWSSRRMCHLHSLRAQVRKTTDLPPVHHGQPHSSNLVCEDDDRWRPSRNECCGRPRGIHC